MYLLCRTGEKSQPPSPRPRGRMCVCCIPPGRSFLFLLSWQLKNGSMACYRQVRMRARSRHAHPHTCYCPHDLCHVPATSRCSRVPRTTVIVPHYVSCSGYEKFRTCFIRLCSRMTHVSGFEPAIFRPFWLMTKMTVVPFQFCHRRAATWCRSVDGGSVGRALVCNRGIFSSCISDTTLQYQESSFPKACHVPTVWSVQAHTQHGGWFRFHRDTFTFTSARSSLTVHKGGGG